MNYFYFFPHILIMIFLFTYCSLIKTMVNLSRLQFKIGKVNEFQVNGIDISNKTSLKDLSTSEIVSLSTVISQGKLPVSFIVNVNARNPNDGTGGYPRTDATIKSLKWRLFIDDVETISGDIDKSFEVPGTGEVSDIPLKINLDLLKFFKGESFERVVNLVLAIGGKNRNSSKITLYATPTVSTILGDIKYPGELKIIDKEFTN